MSRGFLPIALLPFVTLVLIGFFTFSFAQSPAVSREAFGEVTQVFQLADFGEEYSRFIVTQAGGEALSSVERLPSLETFAPVFLARAEHYRLKQTYLTNLYGLLREGNYTLVSDENGSVITVPDVLVRVSYQGHEVSRTFTIVVRYDVDGKVLPSEG